MAFYIVDLVLSKENSAILPVFCFTDLSVEIRSSAKVQEAMPVTYLSACTNDHISSFNTL